MPILQETKLSCCPTVLESDISLGVRLFRNSPLTEVTSTSSQGCAMARQVSPKITRLRAANFRSIESLDLQLGPLNVLVGQNGVGKSNIIDVLRFVRDCLNRGVDQALIDRGGLDSVRRYGRPPTGPEIAIELQCTSGRYDVVYGFSLETEPRIGYRVREEHLRAFDAESQEVCVDLDLTGGRRSSRDSSASSPQSRAYPDSDLQLPKAWWLQTVEMKRDVIFAVVSVMKLLADMSFYNISPESLRAPQQIVSETPFDEKGRNLAAVLRALKKANGPELDDIQGALARLVDGLRAYHITNVGSYLITNLEYEFTGSTPNDEPSRTWFASDLAQESDGTLRILSILAALYQQPPRPLVVVEEPEINIHPGALGVIADLLQEASLRSQILVTTHNPDLIEHFEPDVLRVVEKSDGVTHAGPVAHDQQEAIRKMLFSTAEIMKMEGLRRETAGV